MAFCSVSRGWRGRNICVHQFSTVVTQVGIAELWKWKGLNQSQGLIICCPVVSQASVLPVSHMIAVPGSRVTCYFTASKWDLWASDSYEQASLIELRHYLHWPRRVLSELVL